jgi:HSF-type DNA-binding
MDILSNEENADIISWLPHGFGFVIHKKKVFASDILPFHFKASKFTSFTRKLNRWGFSRMARGPETGAYYHKLFVRDKPELVFQMTSNSGNKYSSAPQGQHLLPAVPMMMPSPGAAPTGPMPFYMQPPPQMAMLSPQQQQAMWQQHMQMFQFQQMQMMRYQQHQQSGGTGPVPPGSMPPMMMMMPPHSMLPQTPGMPSSEQSPDSEQGAQQQQQQQHTPEEESPTLPHMHESGVDIHTSQDSALGALEDGSSPNDEDNLPLMDLGGSDGVVDV